MPEITFSTSSILAGSAAISAIAGAYVKVRKIIKDRAKEQSDQKALERAIVLQEAKEISLKHKHILEAKIEHLESELNAKLEQLSLKFANSEEAFGKDLEHIKDSYASEIRFLGSKIEELKDEVRTSLSQVVTLVSKLIDKS